MDNVAAEVMGETVCRTNRADQSLQPMSPRAMNELLDIQGVITRVRARLDLDVR